MVCLVFQRDSRGVLKSMLGQADKESNEMEDAAMFFANVFGGERFKDYVGSSRPPGFARLIVSINTRSGKFPS